MRILIWPPLLLLSVSASAEAPVPFNRLAPPPPVSGGPDELTDPSATRVCRDRIDRAREERGLPKLDRDKAASNEPLLIAAVDKRLGGCSVMVMRNNLSDIRPLPQYRDGPAQLSPLRGQ
jgi:hypothetical protein